MNKWALMALVLLPMLTGCDHKDRATTDGQIKRMWDSVSSTDYLRARGIGAADQDMKNKTQRMATAREAALTQARYELLTVIKGAHLEGGITVALAMEKNSDLKAMVDRLIRGAEETKTEWLDDDGCVVTLELKRGMVKKMIQEDERWEKMRWQRQAVKDTPAYRNYLTATAPELIAERQGAYPDESQLRDEVKNKPLQERLTFRKECEAAGGSIGNDGECWRARK